MNKNKWDEADQPFMRSVSRGLDSEINKFDHATLERLRTLRVNAVYQEADSCWSSKILSFANVSGWLNLPTAQVSVAMLVAVLSMSLLLSPGSPLRQEISTQQDTLLHSGEHALGEVDVLMSNEDMEFLENLEVYEWLAAEYG